MQKAAPEVCRPRAQPLIKWYGLFQPIRYSPFVSILPDVGQGVKGRTDAIGADRRVLPKMPYKREEYIYKLTDPFTQEVRWVGRTSDPEARFIGHISAKDKNSEKDAWIIELRAKGVLPIMEIIEKVTSGHPIDREKYWIQYHLEQGEPLLNKAHGKRFPIIGYDPERQKQPHDLDWIPRLLLRLPHELKALDRFVFIVLYAECGDEHPQRIRWDRLIQLTRSNHKTLKEIFLHLHDLGFITYEREHMMSTTITVHISHVMGKGKAS